MSVITIEKITRRFSDGYLLLDEFSNVFKDKEFVTLLGPSGCGKTTMLRMIAGFEKPSTGEIRIDDMVVNSDKIFVPPEKRNIGMVFQSYAVWPHMTVFENIAYPLKIARAPKAKIREKVEWILEKVHLSQYVDRTPSQLSGGQQQRVALGRALVAEPRVLLLDEPLSNLDAKLRESMRFEIKEIQRELGITVVYVTHDQTEAMAMSDRIFVIYKGIVQQVGGPTEIYRRPVNQFVADFVGKVNFLSGEAREGRVELSGMGQSIPYQGPCTGKVIVALRPENINILSPKGGSGAPVLAESPGGIRPGEGRLEGRLASQFYLGDVNDCRVDINGEIVRVITDSFSYDDLKEGQKVSLSLREFIVYQDDGSGGAGIVT
ncbi:MAG: ABC transporter ATP-binding protein [Treponema sp.]|jgi:iron(III) transport system ATP-binding protein|nr:ABC transporter ATP-binding protein [Treponema sp.]